MQSLGEFLESKYEGFKKDQYYDYASGVYFNDLLHVLNNIVVKPTQTLRQVPHILALQLKECYHEEGTHMIIQYMNEKNIHNVFNLGFSHSETNHNCYKGINSALHFIKTRPFEIIKLAIGTENYLDLLLNTIAIWKPSNVVIWGPYQPFTFRDKPRLWVISAKPMLFVFGNSGSRMSPIPRSSWDLLKHMMNNDVGYVRKKNDPARRHRKVYKLIKTLVKNHEMHKYEYPYMLSDICKRQTFKGMNANISLNTKRSEVIKLIHSLVYKIIPVELFGTGENRTKIMRFVPKLVNGTTLFSMKVELLLKNVKLNEINWIKPRKNAKMTKHEFLKAKQMFSLFLLWLFNSFICKFVGSFFYVTHGSQEQRLIFYKHHIWRKITKKYMSKYFSQHLSNQPDIVNSFTSFAKNKDYIGRISLHPKKNNFRLIVKPFKGAYDDRVSFLTYQKRLIRPMNCILNTIRYNNDCVSVMNIVDKVYEFKADLLKTYDNKLPQIYAFKFDAKNAYDSLPHDLIDHIVLERLNTYTKKDTIYVQLYQNYENEGLLRGRKHFVTDSREKLNIFKDSKFRMQKVTADTHETFSYTKEQILAYVRSQYKNTCIHTKSRSYFREVGVFQGFPLSGTLFNIVYDYLVNELYSLLNIDSETIIIRLVDDFLVLSTQKSEILKLKKLTARRLKKYNLSTNRQKTVLSTTNISFTGIFIDVQNLICYKRLNDYNNSPLLVSSFTSLYSKLINYGRIWIRHLNLFDASDAKSGINGARENFLSLLKSLVYKFTNSYRLIKCKRNFTMGEFRCFIEKLIYTFAKKIFFEKIGFNLNRFWKSVLKILYHKNIIQGRGRGTRIR